MRQLEPKYFFSPTLLDAFNHFLDASKDWDKFYGDMDEDADNYVSLSEYEERAYNELIDKINRVPHEPIEAASKGTAFNDIVDTLVQNKQCGRTSMSRLYVDEETEGITKKRLYGIRAELDGFVFDFDINLCYNAAAYFGMKFECDGEVFNNNPSDKCVGQLLVESTIDTRYGGVELYGFIDEQRRNIIYDIKTTSRYSEFGKYSNYNQRYVYPYCMIEMGMIDDIKEFEFTIYLLSGGSSRNPLITGRQYREVYSYNHEQAKLHIVNVCERFIEFIETNRDKITDKNIFTHHSHNH